MKVKLFAKLLMAQVHIFVLLVAYVSARLNINIAKLLYSIHGQELLIGTFSV